MKKKILICGSSKNLGKYLESKFSKNYIVIKISSTLASKKNIFKTNILCEKSTESSLRKIKKKYGFIESIIFTIGYSSKSKGNLDDFKKSFDINLFSFVNFINAYLKIFKNKKTKIIVIGSIAGIKNIGAPVEYSVSKNALIFYSQIIAKDLIKKNISLNIISPGNIFSKNNNWGQKVKKNKEKVLKYIKESVPNNKFVRYEEVFDLCEFLINAKNSSLVGSNIIIDGGQTL